MDIPFYNDQSSPDEIDHPRKTEHELVFSSLIAVTNLRFFLTMFAFNKLIFVFSLTILQ